MDILAVIAGSFLTGLGLIFMVLAWRAQGRSEPVALRVIALHEDVDHDDNAVWCPEFMVLAGPHKDRHHTSSVGEERPLHSVGERTMGRIDPISGHIASDAEVSMYRWMPVWAFSIGVGLLGAVALGWI